MGLAVDSRMKNLNIGIPRLRTASKVMAGEHISSAKYMLCEVREGRRLMGLQVDYDGFKLAISLERRDSAHRGLCQFVGPIGRNIWGSLVLYSQIVMGICLFKWDCIRGIPTHSGVSFSIAF